MAASQLGNPHAEQCSGKGKKKKTNFKIQINVSSLREVNLALLSPKRFVVAVVFSGIPNVLILDKGVVYKNF